VGGLEALETVARRLHPAELSSLGERLGPLSQRLDSASEDLRAAPAPAGLEPFHAQFLLGVENTAAAVRGFALAGSAAGGVGRVLEALRLHCRAQEALYPLRHAFPSLGGHFAEPAWHARLAELDPEPPDGVGVGIHAAGAGDDPDARGSFHLYVPERYAGDADWPLVVALHGGFGHGRDFLWTWLREARSRGFLLMAPTSQGTTWALDPPDVDAPALRSMIDYVGERWRLDRSRILLTGLSDGGTYALLAGLDVDAPYTALAVVAGVLHPRNFASGNLGRARGRRIYLAHGALDWMFPVGLAQGARDALSEAGADVTYREIADLSHAYPREENDRILRWFDPALAAEA
jgi:phospholipase/carboxylesterase